MDYSPPPGSSVHGDSPGRNTGVGCHDLLQRSFPTQRSNPGLPHCKQILYHLRHQGSPRILEWEAYPFSGGTSQPRNQTGVSWIAGGFFTSWAPREAIGYQGLRANCNSVFGSRIGQHQNNIWKMSDSDTHILDPYVLRLGINWHS